MAMSPRVNMLKFLKKNITMQKTIFSTFSTGIQRLSEKYGSNQVYKGYFPNYFSYLERDEAQRIHEGYFAIDKKKNE